MATGGGEDGCTNILSKYDALASSLPSSEKAIGDLRLRKYEGFWYLEHLLAPTLAMRDTFVARPTDIILATTPKSSTTWLKALVFCVVHRGRHAPADKRHPLLSSSPHDAVPFLHSIYENHLSAPPGPLLEEMPSPRILAVHTPFTALPASVWESACRVVYLCQDPKDVLVSLYHYVDKIRPEGSGTMTPFAEAFDLFYDGVVAFGPYEDLKEDTVGTVRRLAAFLGCPFTDEEEAEGSGAAAEIVALCSMDKMRSVQANRDGMHGNGGLCFKNSAYFRKGEVGDWKAHMTPEMARRLDAIVEEKLRGSGLSMIGNP
ncbi:unnamed protein product [Urochloa decumbens]|uniref:Sulfotransferase n=1 Tax=Urochloa decumbens TaxID=240449 RepID=A0ABC9B9M6_9POAL